MVSENQTGAFTLVRLVADENGDSHFKESEPNFALVEFAPPAPPLEICEPWTAASFYLIRIPAGWYGDWHPTPAPQAMCFLSGDFSVEASDGEIRRFGPGDMIIYEDVSGRGHRTRLLSNAPALIAATRLANVP
jgi:hypothetical protein